MSTPVGELYDKLLQTHHFDVRSGAYTSEFSFKIRVHLRRHLLGSFSLKQNSFSEQHVLDIGCNNGRGIQEFLDVSCQVYGVDLSEQAVLKAQSIGICAVQGSATSLPFEDGFFSFVNMMEVMQHLSPHQRRETIGEAFRVTRSKGFVCFIFPNFECLPRRVFRPKDDFLQYSYRIRDIITECSPWICRTNVGYSLFPWISRAICLKPSQLFNPFLNFYSPVAGLIFQKV